MARVRAHPALAFIVPLAVLFLTAACSAAPAVTPAGSATAKASGSPGASAVQAAPTPTGSGAETASGPPSASADAGAVGAAATVLTSAKLADAESLAALQGIRFTAAGTAAAAALLSSGVTDDTLWAATYVYASSGGDLAPLRSIAKSTTASPSIRAMAAAGLVGRGDLAGFDPLITELGGSNPMDGAAPAGAIWEFAADVLARYTHTGFGPNLAATEAERATIQARWQAWLDANRAHLRFDAPSELWVTA